MGEEEYLAWRYLARAYLDLYWRNGLSLEEIARRFGVSKETIRSRMKKLNIPRARIWPRELCRLASYTVKRTLEGSEPFEVENQRV